jgi:site-specific DNA-methyltransferase (adenine-specific)
VTELEPYYAEPTIQVYQANSLEIEIPECDHLVTDTPYSERTHSGHDEIEKVGRRRIEYHSWSPEDVQRAVDNWIPRVRGWFVTITDHVLYAYWEAALRLHDRYVFAPVIGYCPGSRVRMQGDGPTCWAWFILAARPRCKPYCKWGALPGGYSGSPEKMEWVGGKPLWLMRGLVRDYSKPGDLVLDPCMGAGTTLRACKDLGRRAIGIDIDIRGCRAAKKRLRQEVLLV